MEKRNDMYPRLTSSEILRGEEDFDELPLNVYSLHFLALTVPSEVCMRHDVNRETACQHRHGTYIYI